MGNIANEHIILVGLPGSGKSTAGRVLAQQLQRSFVDLDALIVEREGMSIPEMFSQKGEVYFREQEALCLREVLALSEALVLSTGGGAPCFHGNMDEMLRKGRCIYLEVPYEELAHRLLEEGVAKRPLLEGISEAGALAILLENKFAHRIPYYQKAGLHFRNTSGASLKELVREVQAW